MNCWSNPNSPSLQKNIFNGLPVNTPDLNGKVVCEGDYKLLNIIHYPGLSASGDRNVVYLALDTETGEKVACKCVNLKLKASDTELFQEAELHDACSRASDGVVNFRHVYYDKELSLLFIIMDLCEYNTLSACVNPLLHSTPDDACIKSIFLQLVDAVEDCHNIGIFHCNLSPENILLKDGGKSIRITDFKYATTSECCKSFYFGRNPFMSPEIQGGYDKTYSSYSPCEVDVWALGMILVYLSCAGYLPWKEATIRDLSFVNYLTRDNDFLLHHFPITSELNEFLKQIFVLDPAGRMTISQMKDKIRKVEKFTVSESSTQNCPTRGIAVAKLEGDTRNIVDFHAKPDPVGLPARSSCVFIHPGYLSANVHGGKEEGSHDELELGLSRPAGYDDSDSELYNSSLDHSYCSTSPSTKRYSLDHIPIVPTTEKTVKLFRKSNSRNDSSSRCLSRIGCTIV